MAVLNLEQMRAESELGAQSTEIHVCYRRLLLEICLQYPSDILPS